MRERRVLCMWRPAMCVAALGLLVCAGSAFGQGADLRFVPTLSSGGSNIDGSSTIELTEDNQYILFELRASNWNNGPAGNFCVLQDGTVTTVACTSLADCAPVTGPMSTCGPGPVAAEMGLECADFDNDSGGPIPDLVTDQGGATCAGYGFPDPPRTIDVDFCVGVNKTRADWWLTPAGAGNSVGDCNATAGCPSGEYGGLVPWDVCGGTRIDGRAADSSEGEVYIATYALMIPAGAKGTWVIGPEMSGDNAAQYVFQMNTLPENWIASFTPMTIVLATGRCCNKNAGSNPDFNLGCADDMTLQSCIAAGANAGDWAQGEVCAGVDVSPADGVDDACPACEQDSDCDDGDLCTQNLCNVAAGECSNPDNADLDRGVVCCDPTNGNYNTIDDGDQCTDDSCDQGTGVVANDLNVGLACDDGNACSTTDECQTDGSCAGTQVTGGGFVCPTGDPIADGCPAEATSCDGGFCECSLCTPLTADVRDGPHGDPNCHDEGADVIIDINMGAGSQMASGAQWMVTWDESCLTLKGNTLGAAFPQSMYLDGAAGWLFVAQGMELFGPDPGTGTTGPALLATLTFEKQPGCDACNVCFDSLNPYNTILTNDTGNAIDICTGTDCSKDIRLAGELSLEVPDNVFTNPDCDFPTAIVTFGDVVVSDTCDGAPTLDCVWDHDGGLNIDALWPNGGEFPQGESIFWCTATNNCGDVKEAYWTVDVSAQHTMDITVQLSPDMDDGPLTRCICFEFFADCVSSPVNWCDDMVFGGDYEWSGHSTNTVKIPKGQYACLTARDPLHTLRSVSGIDCVGNVLVAEFKGDPALDGNWLIGGNIDGLKPGGGPDNIDIRDFGVFVAAYANGAISADTPCGSASPHGDINGDGEVNVADFDFISENFMDASKNSCCPDARGGVVDEPMASITVKELRRRGMGDLAVADLNGDGIVDQADMAEVLQGNLPPRSVKAPRSTRSLRD